MKAVLDISGKQFITRVGATFWIDKVDCAEGDVIAARRVVFYVDGENYALGEPFDKEVVAFLRVQEHARAKKVLIFKKKRRHGYRRLKGFRADQTRVECVALAVSPKDIDKACPVGEIKIGVDKGIVPVATPEKKAAKPKAAAKKTADKEPSETVKEKKETTKKAAGTKPAPKKSAPAKPKKEQ